MYTPYGSSLYKYWPDRGTWPRWHNRATCGHRIPIGTHVQQIYVQQPDCIVYAPRLDFPSQKKRDLKSWILTSPSPANMPALPISAQHLQADLASACRASSRGRTPKNLVTSNNHWYGPGSLNFHRWTLKWPFGRWPRCWSRLRRSSNRYTTM